MAEVGVKWLCEVETIRSTTVPGGEVGSGVQAWRATTIGRGVERDK